MEENTCKDERYTNKHVTTDLETKDQSWKTSEEMVQPAFSP